VNAQHVVEDCPSFIVAVVDETEADAFGIGDISSEGKGSVTTYNYTRGAADERIRGGAIHKTELDGATGTLTFSSSIVGHTVDLSHCVWQPYDRSTAPPDEF